MVRANAGGVETVSAFGPESRMQGMIENVRRLNEENAKLRELLAECLRLHLTYDLRERIEEALK